MSTLLNAAADADGGASRCSFDPKQPDGETIPSLRLIINNETVQIRAVTIKITNLEANQAEDKQADVELSLTVQPNGDSHPPTGKKKKKESMLSRIMKGKKLARGTSSAKKPGTAAAAADADASGAAVNTTGSAPMVSGSSADGSAGLVEPVSQKWTPATHQQTPQREQPAVSDGQQLDDNGDSSRCSSDSSEISIPPGDISKAREAAAIAAAAAAAAAVVAAGSASNTIDSEAGGEAQASETPPPPPQKKEKPKTFVNKKLNPFLNRKKDNKLNKSNEQLLSISNFPHDLPEDVKLLFEIMPSTRLITTVYTSKAVRTTEIKNQKSLMMKGEKKQFTVDGKSRSIWLDPPAGEKVEIWIEYIGSDGGCNRALGRLPGTDKYGYILPDEVDSEGDFLSREEKEEYKDTLGKLVMFQNIYGNDDDEQYM